MLILRWLNKLRPKRLRAYASDAGTDEVTILKGEEYMAINPYNIGAQEGTYDFSIGPEIYRDNGPSDAVATYDKVYQEKKKATKKALKKNYF